MGQKKDKKFRQFLRRKVRDDFQALCEALNQLPFKQRLHAAWDLLRGKLSVL